MAWWQITTTRVQDSEKSLATESWDIKTPIKEETMSLDELKDAAKVEAHRDRIRRRTKNNLYRILKDELKINETFLDWAFVHFQEEIVNHRDLVPTTAEWLLDNYYIIKNQFNLIKGDLPSGFFKELPKLRDGEYQNYPRIFKIAWEIAGHTDSKINREVLSDYLKSYQTVTPLTSGEIWAMPIMLRLVLLDNLTRLINESMETLEKRLKANGVAAKLVSLWQNDVRKANKEIRKMSRNKDEYDTALLIYITERVRRIEPFTIELVVTLEELLNREDVNQDEYIRIQNRSRAINRALVGNTITSLRNISAIDWKRFFEELSPIERILRRDPAGVYQKMDFKSRDAYRHQVELLSRKSRFNEQEVGRKAIQLALEATTQKGVGADEIKEGHVGYYLVDKGQEKLVDEIDYEGDWIYGITRLIKDHVQEIYLGSLGTISLLLVLGVYAWLFGSTIEIIPFGILLILTSNVALGIVNWVGVTTTKATTPPKMEIKEGIPEVSRTIVIVPCLISNKEDIANLWENMEKRYIANRDDNLYFALLTDFGDAQQEKMPEDGRLLAELKRTSDALNKKYGYKPGEKFMYYHRPRLYNPGEEKWMGWERKRGKLINFNAFVCGKNEVKWLSHSYDETVIPTLKYAITLDADTQLPLGTAKKLVGTMMHPLNWPEIDTAKNIVTRGFGIIQPRVDTDTLSAYKTGFSKIMVHDAGLDPYSSVVSDLYQDLFGESNYVGKAIYDIRTAEKVIGRRFPENWLLSHDLLEGSYLRCGLASDIQLLEDFPASYSSYSKRAERWTRGDWQIWQWIFNRVPSSSRAGEPNPLNIIDRFKIGENLRRSLVVPSALMGLMVGWMMPPSETLKWTVVVLSCYLFELIKGLLISVFRRIKGETLKGFFESYTLELEEASAQALFLVTVMAHEAIRNLEAIVKVMWRSGISHRKLLQWATFASAEKNNPGKLLASGITMLPSLVAAGGILALEIQRFGLRAIYFSGIPILWLAAPWIAAETSRNNKIVTKKLGVGQLFDLKVVAAKVWRFFEEYSQEDDNYLTPDNIQIEQINKVAHRTSPTNIGLELLVQLSGYDIGIVGKEELSEKISQILSTIERMEKFRGHLYNWYNTQNLEAVSPVYVSTVDSGNYIACLMALRQGLEEIMEEEDDNQDDMRRGFVLIMAVLQKVIGAIPKNKHQSNIWETIQKLLITMIQDSDNRQNIEIAFGSHKTRLEEIKELWSQVDQEIDNKVKESVRFWIGRADKQIERFEHRNVGATVNEEIQKIIGRIQKLINDTDFEFLFDPERGVFSIGYNVSQAKLDDSYYDLLASESRLGSLVTIALNQISPEHWFKLSRPVTRINGKIALISWGGSMFEYLMPSLLVKDYDNSLIKGSNEEVVERQMEYARAKGVPWGISESGFYAFDFNFNYQYRLFGVPELGFKRDSMESLVIAPYASILALRYRPEEVYANIEKLRDFKMEGDFGFYEAIDFTKRRLSKKSQYGVVKSYMAHHQGMSMLAINNYLNNNVMQRRFHQNPDIMAVEVLLQERIPNRVTEAEIPKEKRLPGREITSTLIKEFRRMTTPHTKYPRLNLVSNGQMTSMMTNTGSSKLLYKNFDISRWRDDPTLDKWGEFVYLKDQETDRVWSIGYQPTLQEPEEYETVFNSHSSVINRRDDDIGARMEVVVSPEKNVEIRKITITNFGGEKRSLEATHYMEIVADTHGADEANMAFSKLFVESSYLPRWNTILFKRRKKPGEVKPQVGQFIVSNDNGLDSEYSTDRFDFVGRGNSVENPMGIGCPLPKIKGTTLDQAAILRCKICLKPTQAKTYYLVTVIGENKKEVIQLVKDFHNIQEIERTWDLAEIHSQIENRHLGINQEEANLFIQLASKMYYPESWIRSSTTTRKNNYQKQEAFYKYGISGDDMIVLVRIKNGENVNNVRQVLMAHEFLRMKNIGFDLVILAENRRSYNNKIRDDIQTMIDSSLSRPWQNQNKGIHLLSESEIEEADLDLIFGKATVIIDAEFGAIGDHLNLYPETQESKRVMLYSDVYAQKKTKVKSTTNKTTLTYFNGWGGFEEEKHEYVIRLEKGAMTPLPWSNVIANHSFGTVVTESGLGFSFKNNSQLNCLTPWRNDVVTEVPGEIIYLIDREDKTIWNPTPLPIRGKSRFSIIHGLGYTTYKSRRKKIKQELSVWVDKSEPIKIMRLRMTNTSKKGRNLKIAYLAEWVMDSGLNKSRDWLVSIFEEKEGILMAENHYNRVLGNSVAFMGMNLNVSHWSGDRRDFIGQNGTYLKPKALAKSWSKSNPKEMWFQDPAGILEADFELAGGESKEIIIVLGETDNKQRAIKLKKEFCTAARVETSYEQTTLRWMEFCQKIEIKTPNRAMNIAVNSWLPYQTLSCRCLARTGFYQNSGAYGFRDQLQDAVNLLYNDPNIAKNQILLAAAHQFEEGDVSHWWHPIINLGVRTRISDDYLWLPWAVAKYVKTSGETPFLEELIPYATMPPLEDKEKEKMGTIGTSGKMGSIYDHCLAALNRAWERKGKHGLPLMGTGDWNDGLNSVGERGRGESVWLGWFLSYVMDEFCEICKVMGDTFNFNKFQEAAKELRLAADEEWDGEWYIRGYFDNGDTLGSKTNSESQIDLIAQSWAAIVQSQPVKNRIQALEAAEKMLVKKEEKVALLLTPPFNKSKNYPGYIQNYPPGIRENGGQYSHGAVWLIEAWRNVGMGNKASETFDLLNPINHGKNEEEVLNYKIEPYVMAGDIYYHPQHKGRGGWSWYTGSAGWMYRSAVESILGFKIIDNKEIVIDPCIPREWQEFSIRYKTGKGGVEIKVYNPEGVSQGVKEIKMDGSKVERILLTNDDRWHTVVVWMG